MAGAPKRRQKREVAQLHGELTTPEPIEDQVKDVLAKIPGAPAKGKKGASPEYMRALVERRKELAKTDPSKMGGRPRTRYSKKEIEENAMRALVPRAVKVLKEQLDSEDEAIAQRAAVKVLEWEKGKPAQTINQNNDNVHTIRYETVVALPAEYRELPDAEIVMGELESGD